MTCTVVILLLLLGSVSCDVTGQVSFKLGVGHTDEPDAPSPSHKVKALTRHGLVPRPPVAAVGGVA